MGTRKGISSLLSNVKSPADAQKTKATSFEKLMAISPFDKEPNLAEIAHSVSEKGLSFGPSSGQSKGLTGQSKGQSKGLTSGLTCGLTFGLSESSRPTPSEGFSEEDFHLFRKAEGPRTKSEKNLWKFLIENGKIIITLDDLSEETRVPQATLRKILRRWVEQKILLKTKAPGNAGLKLEFIPSGRSTGPSTGPSTFPSKIDREDLNLSISLETLQTAWPTLAQRGFGLEQLAQIEKMLTEQGKDKSKVVQGLDHAEWELEKGKMVDKSGQPVTDPCSWVYRSLARDGYYRRPKGYISPAEAAEKDAEAEAKALIDARNAADQARFQAWKTGLSDNDFQEAMKGFPGGDRDAWLKKVWKERSR